MPSDENTLDWKESPEERQIGTFRVLLTALRPNADAEFLATVIARQKDIDIFEAMAEVKSIAWGKPVECVFSKVANARLFCLFTQMKGAISDFDE